MADLEEIDETEENGPNEDHRTFTFSKSHKMDKSLSW